MSRRQAFVEQFRVTNPAGLDWHLFHLHSRSGCL